MNNCLVNNFQFEPSDFNILIVENSSSIINTFSNYRFKTHLAIRLEKTKEDEKAKHFDPQLVDLFFENINESEMIRDKYKN